jgi:four helix bundle protein
MATFHSFEEIQAWQESRKLLSAIRNICKRESVKRDFSFIDQITRATRSISANIAEGFEAMTTPEFIAFLGIAKRSAGEVRSHLYDARDEQYISDEEFRTLAEQTKAIGKMIAGLIHYLQSTDLQQRRTVKSRKLITNN